MGTGAEGMTLRAARRRQHKPELRFEDLHVRVAHYKGDIDEMDKRRVVRAQRPQ
jgi:hypothetical protein